MLASPKIEYIEDTNGADNCSLQSITEQDVIEQKMGTKGDAATSEFALENVDKTGSPEYVIAGESANFEFITPTEFN